MKRRNIVVLLVIAILAGVGYLAGVGFLASNQLIMVTFVGVTIVIIAVIIASMETSTAGTSYVLLLTSMVGFLVA